MKKALELIYPPLFAAFPVLSYYASNQSLIPIDDLWRPLLIAICACMCLWVIASLLLRSIQRGAIVATVVSLGLFGFSALAWFITPGPDSREALALWTVVTLAVAAMAAWKWKWHKPLNFFAVILVAIPTASIVSKEFSRIGLESKKKSGGNFRPDRKKPDVIYVILDGYGRTDVFEREYGFSNRDFTRGLEDRGFYVAKDARSNYCQTELSVASSLNQDYIQNIESLLKQNPQYRPSFKNEIQQSRTMVRFEELGYQLSAITTGFPSLKFRNIDDSPIGAGGITLFENSLLMKTPFGNRSGVQSNLYDARQRWIPDAFARLGNLEPGRGRPKFTIVHILAPHPPFSFGPNGEKNARKGPFGYWDGSDYIEFVGTADEYRRGYADQAKYVGKLVLAALDKLMSNKEKPVVIIQGDHGPKKGLHQATLAKTDVNECFPILNAYLVPEAVKPKLYAGITPVNTFRTIFREMFGDDLPNLPDRSWYSPYPRPFEFTDVTNRIK